MRRVIAIASAVFALDQLTKWLVLETAPFGVVLRLFDRLFLELVLVYNRGVTFGLLAEMVPAQAALGSVTALAGLAILIWGIRTANLGLAVVAGGALGNSLDRFSRGAVVDFIDVYWRTADDYWHWPAFNLADMAIVLGVAWLLLVAKPARRL